MLATMRAALLIQGSVWDIPRYEPDYLTARVLGSDDRLGSLAHVHAVVAGRRYRPIR